MISIDTSKHETATVIHLSGSLDRDAFSQFEAAVVEEIGDNGDVIIIDLAKLNSIDESGLRLLYMALKRARSSGSDLVLAQPQERVWDALTATRLNEIFLIHETLNDALSNI